MKCEELGNGWRLPNNEELYEMHNQLYKKGKGNFVEGLYCTSTESEKLFPVEQRDGSFVDEHKVYCFEFAQNTAEFYFGVFLIDVSGFSFRPVRSL